MSSVIALMSVLPSQLPDMARGLEVSIQLTAASLAVGLPFGMILAVATMDAPRVLRGVALVLIEVGRGAPALVLLELFYFGLPQGGLTLPAFVAATAAFGWSAGAYTSEIFRGSFETVPSGQREAASAVGLTSLDRFRFVVFPQAIRIAIPPVMNLCIAFFQASSLAFAVAVPELMSHTYTDAAVSFEFLRLFIVAAVLYSVITLPAAAFVGLVERRLARGV